MRVGKSEIEWITPLLTLLIVSIGLIAIYSASNATDHELYTRQLTYTIVGIVIAAGIAFIPERYAAAFTPFIYVITLLLLILVLFIGTGPTGRWLSIGTFHIQPSELAKIAVILVASAYLSNRRNDLANIKKLALFVLYLSIPFALILIEPDLGTSMVIPVIAGGMAFWAGMPFLYFLFILSPLAVMLASINSTALIIVIVILIALVYLKGVSMTMAIIWGIGISGIGYMTPRLWMQLKPYQQQRLITFLNPEEDPLGAGYQLIQSKVAIGSGEFWGKGFLQGSQSQRGFLPEQHTDFIFSVIGEEFGFVGTTFLLFLFVLLVLRLFYLTKKVKNPFSSMFIFGIAVTISFQVIVNIGMTVGVMPVTGLPLPLRKLWWLQSPYDINHDRNSDGYGIAI